MFMIWIIGLLMFLAGCMNGVMDTIKHHWNESVLSTIHSYPKLYRYFHEQGWKNAYIHGWRYGVRNIPQPWYVWRGFLDGWHGAKSVMLWCLAMAIGLAVLIPDKTYIYVIYLIFGSRLLFGVGFHLMYNVVLTKKEQ